MASPSVLTRAALTLEPKAPSRKRAHPNRVLQVAAGLVALHVVDDNFLQPPAGTSAAEHLVSGLGALAPLAVAVWAYPRGPEWRSRGAGDLPGPVRGDRRASRPGTSRSRSVRRATTHRAAAIAAGVALLGLGAFPPLELTAQRAEPRLGATCDAS